MMRQEQPLSIKLEHVMPRLIKMITNNEFKLIKEKFPLPIKNEETGLLKYDLLLPFYANIWPKSSNKFILFLIYSTGQINLFRKKIKILKMPKNWELIYFHL